MKKLVLVLAVAFSASLFSCSNSAKEDNKACDSVCDSAAVVEEVAVVVDSANGVVDSAAAVVDSAVVK